MFEIYSCDHPSCSVRPLPVCLTVKQDGIYTVCRKLSFSVTLGACVCVSTLILALQATRGPISDTSGFSTTRAWKKILKRLRSRDMPWKKPIALAYFELIGRLRVPWRHKKLQQRACIDSRMQYTSVASPCQTLRELLAGDHEQLHSLDPSHQLAIPRMRNAPRVCTLSLYSRSHCSFLLQVSSRHHTYIVTGEPPRTHSSITAFLYIIGSKPIH